MRIGLLTGGGDCPGLNAVIRAAVRAGVRDHGDEFVGYRHGWRGVLDGERQVLTLESTPGLLARGGTILGTSRTNPMALDDGVARVRATLDADGVDALIAIGGDDTLGAAGALAGHGVRTVGVPKTIDNDLSATDVTFGFQTAVQIATDAIDRLHTTAESHDRVMVVEVMGRHAGWIALHAGIAGGAHVVLVPEDPFDVAEVCAELEARHHGGANSSIVVVAEGATPVDGTMTVQSNEVDAFGHVRLGGISNVLGAEIERRTGFETRVTILGHVLRGGTPTAFDRVLATRFGVAAVTAVHDGDFGTMVALRGTAIERVPMSSAVGHPKTVGADLLDVAPRGGGMTSAAAQTVDLRSDTVTVPTPEMRRAMADAEVGDDGYGEDPTVRRLESLAAALLAKEAALYVPSGTMANQLALRLLGRPGTEVLCGARAHVYRHENAATAGNAAVQLRPLPDPDGTIAPADVRDAVAGAAHHLPAISALTVENTAMAASGRAWRPAELDAVVAAARDGGLLVHCDGARVWNAAVALAVAPSVLVAGVDTVMFCLSKGLGAPVGSLLCGARDAIDEARVDRARLGGRMRQAGVIAAAGIVALETMVDRLGDDHARARALAEHLADRFPGSVDPVAVETNIVCARLDALPATLLDDLGARGVLAGTIDPHTARFVLHKDVDDAQLARACEVLDELATATREGRAGGAAR